MGVELPVERILHSKPCLCTTHKFLCVLANTGWGAKYVLLGVWLPYFGSELSFCVIIRGHTILGGRVSWKLIASRFSPFCHNPKFGDLFSRTVKISAPSIFWICNSPKWYVQSLDNIISVRPPNMGAKLQILSSMHQKQCSQLERV